MALTFVWIPKQVPVKTDNNQGEVPLNLIIFGETVTYPLNKSAWNGSIAFTAQIYFDCNGHGMRKHPVDFQDIAVMNSNAGLSKI